MKETSCRLLIIGAGPGGYVCAIRAGQLGIDTIVVESGRPGGTCLNVGCIPSKALIHAADEFDRLSLIAAGEHPLGIAATKLTLDLSKMVAWKDGIVDRLNSGVAGLLKKSKVKFIPGTASFLDGKTIQVEGDAGLQVIRADIVLIATGSRPVELPFLPFGGNIISSTEALALTVLPKRLAVVGGGYIGLELGTAFAKLGSIVTVIEAMPRALAQYDVELTRPIMRRLDKLGVTVLSDTKAKAMSPTGKALTVQTGGAAEAEIEADKVLVTVGRKPQFAGLNLERLDLSMNGSFIQIDDRCQTSMHGVYAIGDATGGPMLAHRAMAQGELVAEIVAGHKRSWDKQVIPAICFTDPELVSVGLSPTEADAQGIAVRTAQFPFTANGRSMTKLGEDGFIRIVAHAGNNLILGVQAVGQGVSELSAAFSLAIEMRARVEDIAGTIHAHPTQSEAFAEAALKVLGRALHV